MSAQSGSLLHQSNALREEARQVLALTSIEKALQRFGKVNLIGSYRYGVMVRKDIDFHIIVDAMTTKLVQDFSPTRPAPRCSSTFYSTTSTRLTRWRPPATLRNGRSTATISAFG